MRAPGDSPAARRRAQSRRRLRRSGGFLRRVLRVRLLAQPIGRTFRSLRYPRGEPTREAARSPVLASRPAAAKGVDTCPRREGSPRAHVRRIARLRGGTHAIPCETEGFRAAEEATGEDRAASLEVGREEAVSPEEEATGEGRVASLEVGREEAVSPAEEGAVSAVDLGDFLEAGVEVEDFAEVVDPRAEELVHVDGRDRT